MSRVFAYRATAAGIARRQQERGQPIAAIILPFKLPSKRAYTPVRAPSTNEVSRTRHRAFLKALITAPTTPEDIIRRVAAWHDLSYGDILAHSRYRHFVVARTDCIAAVRMAYPDVALEHIARWFNRDHSAVVLALRKMGIA